MIPEHLHNLAQQYSLLPSDGVEMYAPFHLERMGHTPIFSRLISLYKDKPYLKFLEVGSFEGVSAVFFIKNILTHPSSKLVCIDPHGQFPNEANKKEGWGHDPDHEPLRSKTPKTIFEVFESNVLEKYPDKITYHRENSDVGLRHYSDPEFDVIYLDGLHYSTAILSDMVMSWPLLKKGGYLLLDDFGMDMYENSFNLNSCFFGISSFLNAFQGQYKVIQGPQYLLTIQKTVDNHLYEPTSYLK